MTVPATLAKSNRTSLPTREALLAFIEESPDDVGRREIARAFKVRGGDRARLKQMIKALEDESLIARGRRRRLAASGRLPPVAVVEVTGLDADGDPLARPLSWPVDSEPPRIVMLPERRDRPALGAGDRVLARLTRVAHGSFEGRTIRRLPAGPERVLGFYQRVGGEGRVAPTNRRVKTDFTVAMADSDGARPGELVLAETFPGRRLGLPQARIVERLGASLDDPRSFSLIAIHENRIPTTFPPAALEEAAAARPVTAPGAREDLRKLPLVTIDGADARDFDDAVWAEPDPDEGWHAVVAIADVGHYVRPGSALDRAAYERGNSVYFPDRVVPMLPEALSNDLCSLRPGETRPCLAVHLWIDRRGKLRRHRFVRALIRSAARLTYEQVEAAHGGRPDDAAGPLRESVIAPLFGVYRALIGARRRRGAIDLDLPEREVTLDAAGHVAAVVPRPRLESHRLIEELMIAANVAAAETLAKQRAPVMYRVHDEPAVEKVVELRKFLAGLGHKLPAGQRPRPAHFNRLLREVEGRPQAPAINTAVLRAQAKAAYSPANVGHFGLNLRRYGHFTSPIRRYADLLVHRALVGALGLGAGGLPEGAEESFDRIGEHISTTERRAAAAERDALDRYMAAYMAERVGAVFSGRISGVTRFGLFVALDETGADGIVPRRSIATNVDHDEDRQRLVTPDRIFTLGDAVEVRLSEANVATGSLVFELVSGGAEAPRRGGAKRKLAREKKTARRSGKRESRRR